MLCAIIQQQLLPSQKTILYRGTGEDIMGTIKKQIILDDEDILNLDNARKILIHLMSPLKDFPLEVLTIQSIMERWVKEEIIG